MHPAVMDFASFHVNRLALEHGDVLDLGGRDVNGSVRSLFSGGRYVVVDIAPHPSVDVVADAAELKLPDRFDVVVSTECFEHTPAGKQITQVAFDHLRPGGVFLATMAGPGRNAHRADGMDGDLAGEWYANVDRTQLGSWLADAGFTAFELDVDGTDLRCWARRSL